jgi:hypothetical protein
MFTRLPAPFAAGIAALVLILPASAPAAAPPEPDSPQTLVNRSFARLSADIRTLPKSAVARSDKAALLGLARRAHAASRRNPCRSIALLRGYDRLLKRVHEPKSKGRFAVTGSPRGDLRSDVLAANVALLGLPRARACGGGAKARATVTEATSTVLESDERHVRLKLALPAPTFVTHRAGGIDYQQMFMEGTGETSDTGKPGLPAIQKFVAVPEGAGMTVKVEGTSGYDLNGIDLYPHQADPVDGTPPPGSGAPPDSDFADPPFVKSARAYKARSPFPRRPATGKVLGKMRDLRLGGVDTTGGAYRPRSRRLHVFTSIDVTVRFGGDNKGTFADARRLQSPWESYFQRQYAGTVENFPAVEGHLGFGPANPFCGEDMLIVTSPALKPAADTFATARHDAGYVTHVAVVGSDPGQIGTSLSQIQAYILGQLNSDCKIHPSYVVLFGDTSHIPTWHPPCGENGDPAECSIPSDLPYSLNAPADLFADVQLGRIPAPNLDAADAVVKKIVNYENTLPAPSGDDFYGHATVTAFFEQRYVCVLNNGESDPPNCKEKNGPVNGHYEPDYADHHDGRGFTKTAERIQNSMSQDYGHTVDRVYTKGDDPNVIPEQYYDGTPIPPNLLLPGFPWNGTGADLLGHYNEGRFAILHRDHGWNFGWAHPYLTTSDTPSMNNGTQLPVVFGVNCASATFDLPGNPSFVETQVMKPTGGAVAGFGDTQVSPTWPNNWMALGFFDAPFPDLVPDFGSPTPTKRLGDILLSGKNYMAKGNSGAGEYQEHYLYHLLGDPSGQMWSNDPVDIDVTKIDVHYVPIQVPDPGGPVFKVHVDMGTQASPGTVATLYRNGEAIGRGVLGAGSSLEITPEVAAGPDGLKVEFEADGALPDEKAVEGAPTTPPGPADTKLSLTCPGSARAGVATSFTGHLDPAFAGAQIKVRYTRSDGTGTPIDHTVTTNASGDWTDSATFPRTQLGQWHAAATYDGDSSHKPSSAACDFGVTAR